MIKEYQIHRKAKEFQQAFDIHMKLLNTILDFLKDIK
jgi:hypothetical protein